MLISSVIWNKSPSLLPTLRLSQLLTCLLLGIRSHCSHSPWTNGRSCLTLEPSAWNWAAVRISGTRSCSMLWHRVITWCLTLCFGELLVTTNAGLCCECDAEGHRFTLNRKPSSLSVASLQQFVSMQPVPHWQQTANFIKSKIALRCQSYTGYTSEKYLL